MVTVVLCVCVFQSSTQVAVTVVVPTDEAAGVPWKERGVSNGLFIGLFLPPLLVIFLLYVPVSWEYIAFP